MSRYAYMCTNVYLHTLFTLFCRFGQSMVDTLCLHISEVFGCALGAIVLPLRARAAAVAGLPPAWVWAPLVGHAAEASCESPAGPLLRSGWRLPAHGLLAGFQEHLVLFAVECRGQGLPTRPHLSQSGRVAAGQGVASRHRRGQAAPRDLPQAFAFWRG